MAFTLKIQSKALFGNKAVDFKKLVTNCGLQFGHSNEFYVLEDGAKDNTVILYNPNRIGRRTWLVNLKDVQICVNLSRYYMISSAWMYIMLNPKF